MSESKRKVYLSLSVHQLVDFLLRAGDIDDRIYNQETMKLGTLMHGAYQKKQGKEYLSEYYLCESFERERGTIRLDGRADGIIIGGDYPIIDEIKSTVQPLLDFYEEQGKWHLGQAECYALMYAYEKGLNKIGIRLTYLSQVKDEKLPMDFVYSIKDLEDKVNGYIDDYLFFQKIRFEAVDKRNESCRRLTFPFKKFRRGQRELAKYVYGIASKGGLLFAEAPTGIGKTMSTLFPSVKSFATTENEKIFYSVDSIHEAIHRNREIRFRYSEWTVRKELRLKRDGKPYVVSPWAVTWAEENYYLIGYEEESGKIKHYRVDKMQDVQILPKQIRKGEEQFRDFDLAAFSKKTFGMFGGVDAVVQLRVENALAGVIIDRFGDDVMLIPEDDSHFHVNVPVAVSHQFFGWVTGIGPAMKIEGPEEIRKQYKEYLAELAAGYEETK